MWTLEGLRSIFLLQKACVIFGSLRWNMWNQILSSSCSVLPFFLLSAKKADYIRLTTACSIEAEVYLCLPSFSFRFLAPLFRSSWQRGILQVQRSIYVWSRGLLFFFALIKQMLHSLQKHLTFFPCSFSRLTWGRLQEGCWPLSLTPGLQILPSPGGLCISSPNKLGKMPSSSSSHLVKAWVWIADTCRLWGWSISSVLPRWLPQLFDKSFLLTV